jgi:hypothetical protein
MSQPHKQPTFIETQHGFTAHLRNPERVDEPENIEPRRMAIYRDLIYNNVEGFIANAFPVIRTLFTDENWHQMLRDFIITHHSTTPLFHEIAREFLVYLETERNNDNDPSFLTELAHYEWVELALSVLDAEPHTTKSIEHDDCLNHHFKTSPLAWPLAYNYPVHLIGPDFQPDSPNDVAVFLLVYRNADDNVTFMELNPVSARLIDLLNEGLTGQEAAISIAEQLQHNSPDVVANGAKALLLDWLNRGIIFAQ